MAVQVWIGEKPEHPNERRAIMALANGLNRLDGLYLILANFSVGGLSIDLMIAKQDAIFIIELKHCDGKVFGDVNGPWWVESSNGERKRLNPGRKNPYNQVIAYFYRLTNFLNDHRQDFLSAHKAEAVDFRTCKRVVVIAPTLQEGSNIALDWKVELKGLDELPAFLVTERSSEIDLSEQEMLAIPALLHCTRWKEVNDLIEGVLPTWEGAADPADPPPAPEPEPIAAIAPPIVVEAPHSAPLPAAAFWQGARGALRTTTGRIAAGMAALVLVLATVLLLRPVREVPAANQGVAPLVISTSEAAGGSSPGGVVQRPATCVWNGFQSVSKRWDAGEGRWLTVGPDSGDAPADVVVTLEQVDFCGDHISLTWRVRNNTAALVLVPLRGDTIGVLDSLRNDYLIADDRSSPRELKVQPGQQAQGVAVVPQPVSQNAITLKVTLKNAAFGDTSWLVCLEGCR
ncbi:MAG: NERD domain-containing protein [Chloroflexales bacterium]|nr:NERD domain-containing protein [Chloroflexales bacterium]